MEQEYEYNYALIKSSSTSKFGGESWYVALIKPQYFKNGKIKTTIFDEIMPISIIKHGYSNYGKTTYKIIKVFDNQQQAIDYTIKHNGVFGNISNGVNEK